MVACQRNPFLLGQNSTKRSYNLYLFDLILAQSDHVAARFLQLSRQAERVHDLGKLNMMSHHYGEC